MGEDDKRVDIEVGNGNGCGWWALVLIVGCLCLTAFRIAQLFAESCP